MTISLHRRAVLASGLAATGLGLFAGRARAAANDAVLAEAMAAPGAPPAMAAAVVSRAGVDWIGQVGVRRSGLADVVTAEDRWHLGSNTKAMTAAVWARLIEAGRAPRDMPLSQAFPDMALHDVYAGLTIEDLMRHKAGLTDAGLPLPIVARADLRSATEQRASAASVLARAPTGAVGAFAYANINYVLVGAAIERVTGQAWETAIAEQLFVPLGLTSAGFGAPATNTGGGPNAWGHRVSGGAAVAVDPTTQVADNPDMLGPAGRVNMSAADYARFLTAMLGGGPANWLSADSLARLTTSKPGDTYALGWISAADASGAIAAHEGSNTLWHAIAVMSPGRDRAVLVLSNGGMEGRSVAAPLVGRLLR